MKILSIVIPVIPRTVQTEVRTRLARNPYRILYYNDPEKMAYYDEIRRELEHLKPSPPLDGPLSVVWVFYLPRPHGLDAAEAIPIFQLKGPDLSNLLKGAEDAFTQAGVWLDDGLIWASEQYKHYHEKGSFPRIEATIIYDETYHRKENNRKSRSIDPGPKSRKRKD